MTDVEMLMIHIENVKLFLASAETALMAEAGEEAAKIAAASIAIGAAHSSFSDMMNLLAAHGGGAMETAARIDAMKCVAEGPCSCGKVHLPDDQAAH